MLETVSGPTLYRSCHSNNAPEKGIITLESNPSRGTVLPAPHGKGKKCDKKCKIQKNCCTVTMAQTIEHHAGHSWTPANQRLDQVPLRSQRILLG